MNLLDLFFPKRCVGCGKLGRYFCSSCAFHIRIIQPNEAICPVCEKLAIDGTTHPRCQTLYTIDGLTSFFRYTGPIRSAVKQLKYRRVSSLASDFVSLIPPSSFSQVTNQLSNQVTIVPIPLHSSRFRQRGFNQAEVLAKTLLARLNNDMERLDLSMRPDILRRTRKTPPQVEMKERDKRIANMKDVFSVNLDTSTPRHFEAILLVDDVFTTGATMRSAANVLKRAGVKSVWGITVAR